MRFWAWESGGWGAADATASKGASGSALLGINPIYWLLRREGAMRALVWSIVLLWGVAFLLYGAPPGSLRVRKTPSPSLDHLCQGLRDGSGRCWSPSRLADFLPGSPQRRA